jgi:thiol-disulfide isomerase/thioredoxin
VTLRRPPTLTLTTLTLALLAASATAMAGSGPGDHPAPPSSHHNTPTPFRRPAWIGVQMEAAPASGAGAGAAVLVRHVVRTSPGDKAGMQDGDVLVRVAGTAVTTPEEVMRLVAGHDSGDTLDVVVRRGGHEQTVHVVLAPRPSTDDMMRMEYVGTFAPQLTGLATAAGHVPASITALRGRVAVIEFWAIWCGPCRMTMPLLDGWQSRYGAQGLSVVGITTDPVDRAAAFAAQSGIHYAIASDATNTTSTAYGVRNIPTLFIVDKRGVVREVSVGYDPAAHQQIERLVQQLLAEPAPAVTLTPPTRTSP